MSERGEQPGLDERTAALVRLLALKRHEVPPPGFMDQFSGRVMARIEAVEAGAGFSWRRWLSEKMVFRPVFAGVGGLLAGALVMGVLVPGMDSGRDEAVLAESGLSVPFAVRGVHGHEPWGVRAGVRDVAFQVSGDASSVAPVLERRSPFARGGGGGLAVMPAAYTPGR